MTSETSKNPPITQEDYKQIFRVLHSVISNETEDLTDKCYHFNVLGCMILQQFYEIEASPVVGVAGYCLSADPPAHVVYGDQENGKFHCRGENDHCWIITKEWHIDFTGPFFPEMLAKLGQPPCERKILMKHVSECKDSVQELLKAGDYMIQIDTEKTQSRITDFFNVPFHRDLATICNCWFAKPPASLRQSVPLLNPKTGEKEVMILRDLEIVGSY